MRRSKSLGSNFSLSTRIGPSTDRSSSPTPSGPCSARKPRWAFENSPLSGFAPAATCRTSALSTLRFSVPEQTNAPGIASTSVVKPSAARTFSGSSPGTTGRSFTTESPPFR